MQFTPEQQNAITAMRPLVCVSAGAGSGKTTILIERIAHILDSPELWGDDTPQLERIAAITFTDKAAAEMKARLRRKFRERPAQDNAPAMRFWREMERQVETARITTIHSFCASLLREYALHVGMDPDWGVLTDAQSASIMDEVVDTTLYRLLEERCAAAERLAVGLNLATLKQALTTVLAQRWKFQRADGDALYGAPKTLSAHWEQAIPALYEQYLRSFQGSSLVCEHLAALEEYAGCCPDPSDKREVMRAAYEALFHDIYHGAPDLGAKILTTLTSHNLRGGSKTAWGQEAYTEVKEAINAAREFLKSECLMPEIDPAFEARAAQMTCDFYRVSRAVMAAYADARLVNAAIDFDDMINETLRLLRENKSLRQRAARSLRFLLIDEFQDTDGRQLEVARLLADVTGGPDLFIVGDAKQSIYLFRGAEVSLFKGELERDPESIALPVNYRSLPDVICFINDFFQKSEMLKAVEHYRPMQVSRPAMNMPRVELFVPDWDDPGIKELNARTSEREAQFIARRIREMCGPTEPLLLPEKEPGTLRPAGYDDIVLLFRRGGNIHAYEAALREAHIPYNRIAGEGYFLRREIQDMLALLKTIQDPWDEEALLTALRSPLVALSDESLMRLAQLPGGLAAAFHSNAVPEHFDETEVLENARAFFKRLYAAREMPPGALLRRILEETNVEAVLLSQHLGLQRASNLRKMLQLADTFSQSGPATLAEFTRYLDDVSVREIREGEAMLQSKGMGAVTLMTIHKSKGLEFPVVFIPEMWAVSRGNSSDTVCHHDAIGFTVKALDDNGNLKRSAAAELIARLRNQDDAAESARILYVAMTRARDYLVVCGHAHSKKSSWAETLNTVYGLENGEHGAVLTGDRWQAVLKRAVPETPPALDITPETATFDPDILRAAIAPVEAAYGEREAISVSRLLELMARTPLEDADVPEEPADTETMSAGREMAMARGTLMHRMFELWDFKNDSPPELDALINEAGLGMKHRDALKEGLTKAVAHMRASAYRARFAAATSLRRETPFILAVGNTLVHGVIDALVDDALIVDYKTGKPGGEHERDYERQLLLYAAALREITGNTPEQAMLWYADYGVAHVIAVTHEAIDNTLALARKALAADNRQLLMRT